MIMPAPADLIMPRCAKEIELKKKSSHFKMCFALPTTPKDSNPNCVPAVPECIIRCLRPYGACNKCILQWVRRYPECQIQKEMQKNYKIFELPCVPIYRMNIMCSNKIYYIPQSKYWNFQAKSDCCFPG